MIKQKPDDDYVQRRFPTRAARKAADEAIDPIPVSEPMSTFLDTWIAAYRKAGGIEKKV